MSGRGLDFFENWIRQNITNADKLDVANAPRTGPEKLALARFIDTRMVFV
ncbi:MAG TPA: hypothetical protein VJ019_07790 [Aestuariivirga sp.]|jgi:hypothetical protein|nr:hypothetical protein [Aestuariivirga sp.]